MKKRIVDKKILQSFYARRCLVCGKHGCDPAHIKSVGSGGADIEENLMPLCREHHTQQHQIGMFSFLNRHPQVECYLLMKGWEINFRYKKLFKK